MSEHHEVESLGEKIRRLRLEKGMTQGELADGFVTVSMISQIERDRNTASVELLQHIAKKLQLPLYELVEDEVEQMQMLYKHKLIKVYLETKEPEEAEPLLHSLRKRSDLSQMESIELTVDLGECFYQQRRYNEALELLVPLAEELETVNLDDAHVLALVRYWIGNVYYQLQNYSNAVYNYRKAYDFTGRFASFDVLAARISYNVGITLQLIGHSNESIDFLQRSFSFFERTDDLYKLAATIFAQGISYKNIRDYKRATECLTDAKGLFYALNHKQQSYMVQRTIASALTAHRDPQLALKQLHECIPAFEELQDRSGLLLVYSKLAEIYLRLPDLKEADLTLSSAKKMIVDSKLEDSQEAGVCYQICARYYFSCRNFHECIRYSLKSSAIFDTIGLQTEQVDSLQIACDAYHAMGDFEQAFLLERQSNLILQQLKGRRETIL